MKSPLLFLDEDSRLLDGIRRGDENALAALYAEHRKPITAFVTRNNGTPDDADDMLQEALVVLWERVRCGRFEHRAKLGTFLFGVVRNMWLRRLAHKRREIPQDDFHTAVDDDPSALESLIDREQTERVHSALSRLGETCRRLLHLYYWEERSMEEIAAQMGFANADTAKAKKYQCKKALHQLLLQGE